MGKHDASLRTEVGFCCDIDEQTSRQLARLSFYSSEKTLRAAFEGFSELVEEYATGEAASAAVKEMNGKTINGWVIVVDAGKPKSCLPRYGRSPNQAILKEG